jgi:hypothetical protein
MDASLFHQNVWDEVDNTEVIPICVRNYFLIDWSLSLPRRVISNWYLGD